MKKLFLTTFLMSCFFIKAQQISENSQQITDCRFVPTSGYYDMSKYSNRYQTIPDDGRKFILNVKFHYVLGTLGQNPDDLSEEKMLRLLATMNLKFNSIGVFFKYRGTDFIKDDNYVQVGLNGLTETSLINKFTELNYYTEDAINVFVIRGNGSQGRSGKLFLDAAISFDSVNGTLLHETGHLLGLMHLAGLSSNYEALNSNLPSCIETAAVPGWRQIRKPIFLPNYTYENVTRDINNPNYNADLTADLVYDTDACFAGSLIDYMYNFCRETTFPYNYTHFKEDPRVVDNTGDSNISSYYCFNTFTKYSYTSGNSFYTTATNGVDVTSNNLVYTNIPLGNNSWQEIVNAMLTNCTSVGNGETYKIADNLVNNYMSVPFQEPGMFTVGQGRRIRETLLGNVPAVFGSLQSKLNLTEDGSPDISVLYQPFAVNASNGGSNNPNTTTAYSKTATPNQDFTGVNVWNCGPFTMRFQTGFDCEFYSNNGTVSQTPYQQYNVATATQIGVKIPILGQQIYNNVAPVCFYSFEPYTSGDIKSTYSLGSTYYSQEELDKIKASDPKLFEQLQSGQFHIITKETDSGFVDQKVIYKN